MIDELCHAATRVGHALAQWRAEGRFAGRQVGTQFKAEVDRWAQELWFDELRRIAPGTTIVSEEDEASHTAHGDGNYWLLDPLDGTASFANGFSGWVTQVAWMVDHEPVIGVVFAPLLEELFHAERAKGAFRNGERLALDCAAPVDALVDNYPTPRGIAAAAMNRFGIARYLESGSLGLKICRVAARPGTVFLKDVHVKSWDVAPGDLILTEAGGALTTLQGNRFDYRRSLGHTGLVASHSLQFAGEVAEWARTERALQHSPLAATSTVHASAPAGTPILL